MFTLDIDTIIADGVKYAEEANGELFLSSGQEEGLAASVQLALDTEDADKANWWFGIGGPWADQHFGGLPPVPGPEAKAIADEVISKVRRELDCINGPRAPRPFGPSRPRPARVGQ
jgi:hypothetical protein